MTRFFKREEKKPISFASVEMQKAHKNYVKWIVVLLLLMVVPIVFFWIK